MANHKLGTLGIHIIQCKISLNGKLIMYLDKGEM